MAAATVLAALAAAGCGADPGAGQRAEPTPKATVVMDDGAYRPSRVTIPVGGRVTWVNGGSEAHTAETDGVGFFEYDRAKLDRRNRFDIHTLQPGEAESVEFDTPGTYRFHSSFDEGMRGSVEVVAADG